MLMRIVVTVFMAQNKHRSAVHHQSDDGHKNRLIEGNGNGMEDSLHALPGHREGKNSQENSAGKPAQGIDLSSSETKARITGMAPGVNIRVDINKKRCRVRG